MEKSFIIGSFNGGKELPVTPGAKKAGSISGSVFSMIPFSGRLLPGALVRQEAKDNFRARRKEC